MEDFDVDDVIQDFEKRDRRKKKLNSKDKGNRTELGLVKVLNERFKELLAKNPAWGSFSRSVGSGNRWGQGQLHLPKHAKDTYTGDLTCPTKFLFVIESKGGYNDVDLCGAFADGDTTIDSFLQQVSDDAARSSRKPLLVWKKDRKPRLAAIRAEDLPVARTEDDYQYFMRYREWVILPLEVLLARQDAFFFDLTSVAGSTSPGS